MTVARSGPSWAGAVLLVAGLGSAVLVTGLLVRRLAVEKDRSERSETHQREAATEVATLRHQWKEARDSVARLEADRSRREVVVEGELSLLRRDLAAATEERDALRETHRSAAAERDRAVGDLLAARRDIESLKNDLARATRRAGDADALSARRGNEAEEARRRLDDATGRLQALLRPLLQDLRSPDGTHRVRAHEALSAYAGRDLHYRPNGTPEEREADAKAIEQALTPR